ncbi:MAG: hypothetical protein H0X17_14645, partial [Deltaproteobacteria bacterium]|nr:hypothetical protein [Deltaproteobacteria bacterium]
MNRDGQRPARGALRRWWDARVYPLVVDRVCGTHAIMDERQRWVPRARGRVLE